MPSLLTLFIGWITQGFCVENANVMEDQAEIRNPIHFIYEENDWLALPPTATSVCLYNIEGTINDEFLNHGELESLRILTTQIELSDPQKLNTLENLRALSISTIVPINKEIFDHLPESLEYVHLSNLDDQEVLEILNRLPKLMEFTVCLHQDALTHYGKDAQAIFDSLEEKKREINEQFPGVSFSFFIAPQDFELTNPFEGIPDHYLPHEKED
jgi:hypothetical protein